MVDLLGSIDTPFQEADRTLRFRSTHLRQCYLVRMKPPALQLSVSSAMSACAHVLGRISKTPRVSGACFEGPDKGLEWGPTPTPRT